MHSLLSVGDDSDGGEEEGTRKYVFLSEERRGQVIWILCDTRILRGILKQMLSCEWGPINHASQDIMFDVLKSGRC